MSAPVLAMPVLIVFGGLPGAGKTTVARDAWRSVAAAAAARLLEVELTCSDPAEHRRRVDTRDMDVPGLARPTWQSVLDRAYEPWDRPRLLLDTARVSAADAALAVRQELMRQLTA